MTDYDDLARKVKERARALGFDLCGIAPAAPSVFKAEYHAWLERGFHGEMAYMARDPERRLDPEQVLPGARSIIVVGMNYYTESDADRAAPDEAIFARYARGDDYHDVMTPRLRALLTYIVEEQPFEIADCGLRNADCGAALDTQHSTLNTIDGRTPNTEHRTPTQGRVYVDTGPILEREVARRAGLGWFGKNTMLINTRRGSYFLLGEILLNLPLPPDVPAAGGCGTCTRCLDACPTGAIVRPYEVDARRCISYLTIELKGPIPDDLAPRIGNRVFGCDICQEVCPFNRRRAALTDEPAFQPRPAAVRRKLADLACMTEEEFRTAFKGSPVKRAKLRGLIRNVAAALSSPDEPAVEAAPEHALNDPEPLVRSQAERSLMAIRTRQADSHHQRRSGR